MRQSKVEEEMKNVLKQYLKSRDITKEEYKNISKKAVPQEGFNCIRKGNLNIVR